MSLLANWRQRRNCWHHDHTTGQSWITGHIIDAGRAKLWRCSNCDRTWVT